MSTPLSTQQYDLLERAQDPNGAALYRGGWHTARSLVARGLGEIVRPLPIAKWYPREGRFIRNDAGVAALGALPKGTVSDPLYSQRAIAVAARLAGSKPEQLLSDWRRPKILVRARWAVMMGMAKRGAGQSAIGRRLCRDHATVQYGISRGNALAARDAAFARLVAEVDAA